MKWIALLSLLLLGPVAEAQVTDEQRAMAAAFNQADLDTLGMCQGRLEGVAKLIAEFEGWMQQEGYLEPLASIRKQQDQALGLIATFSEVRTTAARAKGLKLAGSDAARAGLLASFQRRDGESTYDAYNRWHDLTKLPAECREALKRGRYKIGVEGL